MNVIPDAVWQALDAAHSAAGGAPVRTGVIINGGAMAATRHGSALGFQNVSPQHSMHLSRGRTAGTEAEALTRSAHLADRGVPLRDREKNQ